MEKEYYLGLDMGTNSVGWAVTDDAYNLIRFKGKDMWGIRGYRTKRVDGLIPFNKRSVIIM